MHKLGISLYPEHSTKEKDWAYMELAAKYGFSRIFTCLLSVTETREEIIERFTEFVSKAHEFGYEVSVDTNGEVFNLLGAKADDISVFANMGVDIIRLDVDLGLYGKEIMKEYSKKEYDIDLSKNYNDCGVMIFDKEVQDTHSGGSGCACCGTVFSGYFFKQLKEKNIKKCVDMKC